MNTPDSIYDFLDKSIPDIEKFCGLTYNQTTELHKLLLSNFARHIQRDAEYLEELAKHGEFSLKFKREQRSRIFHCYAEILKGMAELDYSVNKISNEQTES